VKLLRRREKRAAVLGCGPAGLFAAHALVGRNWDVTIFSKKRRSEMFGAQYLHRPLPGMSFQRPNVITYRLIGGSVEDYRAKVYGRRSGITVSPEILQEEHKAWDIREAYWNAWDVYADRIESVAEIGTEWVSGLLTGGEFNAVLSSIPAPSICYKPDQHVFDSQQVWAIGDAPERGVFCPVPDAKPFEILLNASRDVGWYRTANVYGYRTAEWPEGRKPPLSDVSPVIKPISTDCDCFAGSVTRIGRYGQWTKGVLSHEAYGQVVDL
jgi:hypothetical protein